MEPAPPTPDPGWSGHAVLVLPVPPLEPFVRARTAHYDPSFLSSDPAFTHAHLTVLVPVPWPLPDGVGEALGGLAASTTAPEVVLQRLAAFPDGVLHLVPEPDAAREALQALHAAVRALLPQVRPYDGAVADPVPHVTVDRLGPDVDEESTHAALAPLLPVRWRPDALELHWYGNHACRVLRHWPLATGG